MRYINFEYAFSGFSMGCFILFACYSKLRRCFIKAKNLIICRGIKHLYLFLQEYTMFPLTEFLCLFYSWPMVLFVLSLLKTAKN